MVYLYMYVWSYAYISICLPVCSVFIFIVFAIQHSLHVFFVCTLLPLCCCTFSAHTSIALTHTQCFKNNKIKKRTTKQSSSEFEWCAIESSFCGACVRSKFATATTTKKTWKTITTQQQQQQKHRINSIVPWIYHSLLASIYYYYYLFCVGFAISRA